MRRVVLSLSIAVLFAVLAEYFVGWQVLVGPWLLIDDPIVILGPVMLLITSYLRARVAHVSLLPARPGLRPMRAPAVASQRVAQPTCRCGRANSPSQC